MNAETKAKLIQACLDARGYGACQYVDDEGPKCVIGCFAHAMGTPVEGLGLSDFPAFYLIYRLAGLKEIGRYEVDALQAIWDRAPQLVDDGAHTLQHGFVDLTEDEARMAMLLLVESDFAFVDGAGAGT